MAIARRDIVGENEPVHVYFRCHNGSFFFRPVEVKKKIVGLLAKYKAKYCVKIFDFNIMDNHAHLYMQALDADALGAFMRTVESQISRFINKTQGRDSQAIRERYKSPVVTSSYYANRLVKYIYANRYRIDRTTRPDQDYWCSAFWRIHKPHKLIADPQNESERKNNLLAKLLDDYTDQALAKLSKKPRFIQTLVEEAMRECDKLKGDKAFKSSHTLGDERAVAYRGELLSSLRKETGPPGQFEGTIAFGGSRSLIKIRAKRKKSYL